MKINLLILLFSIFLSELSAQTWEIDYAHSSINFSINHYFTPVYGRFQRFEGTLDFNVAHPEVAQIVFEADVASVNTDDAKRDNDLLSEHFFNAKQFSKIIFQSKRVEKISENSYKVFGRLTIRDITHDVEIPFMILGLGDHPTKRSLQLIGIKSEFKLSRTDYGVGTGDWVKTLIVGDEVSIVIVIEATQTK